MRLLSVKMRLYSVIVTSVLITVTKAGDGIRSSDCETCHRLVNSFESGMTRTQRGKFDGGDAEWEKKKQAAGYAQSEVRLVEIQEELCRGETKEQQCHALHHDVEDHLEAWWTIKGQRPNLKEWLCTEKIKLCCPPDHFGPDCTPCEVKDDQGKMCSGNGACQGAGTRKGDGKCKCDKGYMGELCSTCAKGYYESGSKCSACHKSCLNSCNGPKAKDCVACKKGYRMDSEKGCQDIDECSEGSDKCAEDNKYCVNKVGSFKCNKCDRSCKGGCSGEGADLCNDCAEGFVFDGDTCVSGHIKAMSNTRTFTYMGLCLVACIVFQRSAKLAAILGAVIAAYIGLSEYLVHFKNV